MATRMQQRRGTAAEWAAANPVLGNGELGYETDTKILKIGDGVTPWVSLPLSSQYLRANAKAADSDLLDGLDSTQFLRVTGKAGDSELLDGLDSTAFVRHNVSTAKGDLLIATVAGTVSRQPVGGNDQVLIADSTTSTGVRWGTPPAASFGFAEVFLHGGGY